MAAFTDDGHLVIGSFDDSGRFIVSQITDDGTYAPAAAPEMTATGSTTKFLMLTGIGN